MKFANIFRFAKNTGAIAVALGLLSISLWNQVGFATPYLTPEELARIAAAKPHQEEKRPVPSPPIRHSLDEVAYFAEYVQICDFLVRLQHPGPGDDMGGMIEGETGDVASIIETDNTQEAIRVWAQYGTWTGDTARYSLPIQLAWGYCLRHPAWQEESSPGDYGYYRSHNCGWGLIAEMKYRSVYSDTSYKGYADSCAAYLASHPLPFNQGAGWLRRLLPLVQGWSAGTLYLYAEQEGNDAWRQTALAEARRVRNWIEENPSRLYNNEEWALCGGTALWGVCVSLFDAYPDSGEVWLPAYASNLDTWQTPVSGGWNHSWNTWYGHAHHLVFAILEDSTYWTNAVFIADSLLRFDMDNDGGITASGLDPDTMDQSWVSSYLNWMDLERIISALPTADVAAVGFVSPSPSVPHMAGDSLHVAVRVLNTGWSGLDSVLVKVEGEFADSLRVNLAFGLDTTILFATPWVSPIQPNQPAPIPLTLTVYHPQDMRPDNDTKIVFFDIRQGAFVEGYVKDGLTGLGIPGIHLTFYHEAFPESPYLELDVSSDDGSFSAAQALMLGNYTVEAFPPLAHMPLSQELEMSIPWSIHNLEILLGQTQIALMDDDAGATYESYLLATLSEFAYRSRHWDVALHGLPELTGVPVILWMTGDDSVSTLTSQEQTAIEGYLDDGGCLLLTGQDITDDLQNGSPFLRDVLHCDVQQYNTNVRHLFGTVGDPVGEGLELFLIGSQGAGNQRSPSSLQILPGGNECFRYAMADSQAGGVRGDHGTGKFIFLAFGLEAVSGTIGSNTRTDVLARAFDWFGNLEGAPWSHGSMPSRVQLYPNWPNPFNTATTIAFFAPPGKGPVSLVLYNLLGQQICPLFSSPTGTGSQTLHWNGEDSQGRVLPTGTYFYRLSTPHAIQVKKLQIIR
ncbi:MAG: T9SS type A sorting domain-containing protein [bacterium]